MSAGTSPLSNRPARFSVIAAAKARFVSEATIKSQINSILKKSGMKAEQKDIFELIHRRRKKSSTIFCSQVHWDGWYEQLGGDASPLADAILDRIVYDAYRIHIQAIDSKNDKSMREVYGLDKRLRE